MAGDRGVSEWQEHLTQQRTAAGAGEKPRRSRLFGLGGESGEDGQKQEKRKSRIFGRQQNHDGLSDPVPEEKNPFDRTPWKDRIRQAESGMPGEQAQVQRPVQNPWNGFPVPEQEPAASSDFSFSGALFRILPDQESEAPFSAVRNLLACLRQKTTREHIPVPPFHIRSGNGHEGFCEGPDRQRRRFPWI